jgi:short-subunit dehydrogenase
MGIAIITGASSGIGREFALQLKALGEADGFLLIARRRDRLEALAEELGGAEVLSADLCTAQGIEEVRAYLEEKKPCVRYLVNAAGFGKYGAYDKLSEQEVVRMIDLNVKALVLITHMTLPYMERGGHIIEMGSGSCFTPLPHFNIYASSKSFVLHYSKGLKDEIAPLGVSVTCFCPGWVDTEFFSVAEEHKDAIYPKNPKPMLSVEKVVRYAIQRARRGKLLAVTNWYTKMQHMLFKLVPDRILTRLWMSSVLKVKKR